jgi:hypothetical protein
MAGRKIALDARWSPDGGSIVYADLNSIYVSDKDGANLRKIWDAPERVAWPYFSPDSRHIRVSVLGGKIVRWSKIWELNADGTNPHPLPMDWPEDADQVIGQWTPDGNRFIFISTHEGLDNIYEIVPPPRFNFWKKPSAVRLTAGQIDVLAATPSRDSTGLFMIGRIAQGAMHVYDPKQKRFCLWAASRASAICKARSRNVSNSSGRPAILACSVWPSSSSMAMKYWPSRSPTS